ncbi:MAG: flagellar motor switch protein FliN [Agromyces sp.]
MTTSTTTAAASAADELVRTLPSERTLTAVSDDPAAIDAAETFEASHIGTASVEFAVAFLEADELGAGDGLAPENLLHPALQAAGRRFGTGVLGDVRRVERSPLFEDPSSAVFTLLDGESLVGWFAARERSARDDARGTGGGSERLGRINGVEMSLAVEIGRTRMTVRDILNLEPGAVVELDRSAGAPADILLNGRVIAHGEVVVVDQDYAVRVTRILDTQDSAQ